MSGPLHVGRPKHPLHPREALLIWLGQFADLGLPRPFCELLQPQPRVHERGTKISHHRVVAPEFMPRHVRFHLEAAKLQPGLPQSFRQPSLRGPGKAVPGHVQHRHGLPSPSLDSSLSTTAVASPSDRRS